MVNWGALQGICSHFSLCPLSSRFGALLTRGFDDLARGLRGSVFFNSSPLKSSAYPTATLWGNVS